MINEKYSLTPAETEDFNLPSLSWTEQRPAQFDHISIEIKPGFHPNNLNNAALTGTKYTFREIDYRGSKLKIAGRDDVLITPYTESRALNIYVIKDSGYVELTIEINEHSKDPETPIIAERTVVRHDLQRKLPSGIGRIFTWQAYAFLQQLANSTGRIVLERIDRTPGHDGVELSGQEWDRMFMNELNKRGYNRISENIFSKEFHPE